jgi:hypothetical protein
MNILCLLFCLCSLATNATLEIALSDAPLSESVQTLNPAEVRNEIESIFTRKINNLAKKFTIFKVDLDIQSGSTCKCFKCTFPHIIAECHDCLPKDLFQPTKKEVNFVMESDYLSYAQAHMSVLNNKRLFYASAILNAYKSVLFIGKDKNLTDQKKCENRYHCLLNFLKKNKIGRVNAGLGSRMRNMHIPLFCANHTTAINNYMASHSLGHNANNIFITTYLDHTTSEEQRVFLQFLRDGFDHENRCLSSSQAYEFIKHSMDHIDWNGFEFAVHFIDYVDAKKSTQRFSFIVNGNDDYIKTTKPKVTKR